MFRNEWIAESPYIGVIAERPSGPLSLPRGGFECFEIDQPVREIKSGLNHLPLTVKWNDYHESATGSEEEGVGVT